MRDSKFINFNKEILFGEVGALLFAPIFGFLSSLVKKTPDFISFSTLAGSVFGGSAFWWTTRVRDDKKEGKFSLKKLGSDLSFYTPVAILITFFVSYPTTFFITGLIVKKHVSYLGSTIGEISGFAAFLLLINGYRYVLKKTLKKTL